MCKVAAKKELKLKQLSTFKDWERVFDIVYPGYDSPTACSWFEVTNIVKFGNFFGHARYDDGVKLKTQSCRSNDMVNLFGSGVENEEQLKKPHCFVLEMHNNEPFITSYFSSDLNRPNNTHGLQRKIFQFIPDFETIKHYDLKIGFEWKKSIVVQELQKLQNEGCLENAGLSSEDLAYYANLQLGFQKIPDHHASLIFGKKSLMTMELEGKLGNPKANGTRKQNNSVSLQRRQRQDLVQDRFDGVSDSEGLGGNLIVFDPQAAENVSEGEDDDPSTSVSENGDEDAESFSVEEILEKR